jgi:putative phosphoribosyl transferase
MAFRDRADAGRQLVPRLLHLRDEHPVVLALPRGGVPVAYEVARALGAPLDVIVVRKLGVPAQPELAMGAIGEGGVRVLNDDVLRVARSTPADVAVVEARERAELDRRAEAFRGGRAMLPVEGRTVIVIDDGIATGSTALAALQVARAHGARRVVLAAPVAPPETVREFEQAGVADEVVVVEQPARLFAIGSWYDNFAQTSDAEVVRLLHDTSPPP